MSRRQTDLEPGVEPDAGEPEYGAPNGRPPTPPPSWRPDTRPPTGPPNDGPPSERPPTERRPPSGGGTSPSLRWVPWIVLALIAAAFVVSSLAGGSSSKADLTYSQFVNQVDNDNVKSIDFNKSTGSISGKFNNAVNGKTEFSSSGPKDNLPDPLLSTIKKKSIDFNYVDTGSNILGDILLWVLPLILIIGLFVWMSRRAQGQMGAVMNIGKSRAKVYNTEKPKTTFADVAGYGPVKQEISEVVDFLKNPGKFKEIGARIPKGVLLVGPPGTGKTLIARAVAGEAGVPFVSVTGSDFMEMFVGVGAARVRDLFQTARKQAPAIIFVDEIDSIGRKRGAGLGGGHDEREQTLNQMLAEMDGFEATEGIVMMAATNRPDVLDPALLRPGRFDRQIMVPLPTQEERRDILVVHFKDKKMSSDVDVNIVARGTPGMAGADLANLVNEAALFAVRRGDNEIHANDFDDARDRVLMGLRRPSIVMNDLEKEHTAYHEAGHAVAAYVFEHADPVHKVTILPTGMALGMTQQMPVEERYSHDKEYLARLAGRVHGRARGRGDHVRHQIDRRPERPRARHRDRPPHGAGVGHERSHRADGLGLRGRGLPGRGPRAHPRLLRRDRPGDRRRGRAHPARRGEPHPRHPLRAPARSGRGGRGAARAGDRRRRRGLQPRRHRDGPQERWAPDGVAGRRLRGDRRDERRRRLALRLRRVAGRSDPLATRPRRGRVPGCSPGRATRRPPPRDRWR